jgi:alpha-1,6-mannosyltransferase
MKVRAETITAERFYDVLLLCTIIFYLYVCPFTKVEESFNMQAIHDLVFIPMQLENFDHLEFPGVVPRTFIGPITVASASLPVHVIMRTFTNLSKLHSQFICRAILGIFAWEAFVCFRKAVSFRFGGRAGAILSILTAVQFHLPFYMSRTLPNTFALVGCLYAFAFWLRGAPTKALLTIGVMMVLFRCDMLVLLAPLALQLLIAGEVNFWRTLAVGIAGCALALLLTVAIDSYFWRR